MGIDNFDNDKSEKKSIKQSDFTTNKNGGNSIKQLNREITLEKSDVNLNESFDGFKRQQNPNKMQFNINKYDFI